MRILHMRHDGDDMIYDVMSSQLTMHMHRYLIFEFEWMHRGAIAMQCNAMLALRCVWVVIVHDCNCILYK